MLIVIILYYLKNKDKEKKVSVCSVQTRCFPKYIQSAVG
jgi:hypothetical protein